MNVTRRGALSNADNSPCLVRSKGKRTGRVPVSWTLRVVEEWSSKLQEPVSWGGSILDIQGGGDWTPGIKVWEVERV
jgi:hypothetical protein